MIISLRRWSKVEFTIIFFFQELESHCGRNILESLVLYLSFLNLRFMLLKIMLFLNFEVLIDKIFLWIIIIDSILFKECFMISKIWLFRHQLYTKVIFESFSFSMFSTISKVYFSYSSSDYTSNVNSILSTFKELTIIFMNISIHSVFKS